MTYILALDQSLNSTAANRILITPEGPVPSLEMWTPKNLKGGERLNWFAEKLEGLEEKPVLICCEGYAMQGSSVVLCAELGGVIQMIAHRIGIPFISIPPSSVKEWATGRGNADKTAMLLGADRKWPHLGIENDDQADSLWIGDIAYKYHTGDEGSNPVQRKVLGRLRGTEPKPVRARKVKATA